MKDKGKQKAQAQFVVAQEAVFENLAAALHFILIGCPWSIEEESAIDDLRCALANHDLEHAKTLHGSIRRIAWDRQEGPQFNLSGIVLLLSNLLTEMQPAPKKKGGQ